MSNERFTILIVDDNAENIDILHNILKEVYNVKSVLNGEQALNILEKVPRIDMILLDIIMPGMNGYEVCKRIKSNTKYADIPIIFISAMSDHDDEQKGLELGAVDYITKPINPAITLSRIKTHLELYEKNKYLEQRVHEELTKRLEHQKMLLRQSRLAEMGEMMNAITHQWKQPLSIIGSATTSIYLSAEMDNLTREEVIEKVNHIENAVEFMSQTILDFKNYFDPNKKRIHFNIKRSVETLLNILAPLLKSDNIQVIHTIPDDLIGHAIESEFKQVMLNLINNARDAINTARKEKTIEGKITITGYIEGDLNILEVSDNGGGVDQNVIEHIFNDYFTSKKENGTGIGLSICKMIIEEEMGGTISVSNTEEGAKFSIKLPHLSGD